MGSLAISWLQVSPINQKSVDFLFGCLQRKEEIQFDYRRLVSLDWVLLVRIV